MSNLDRRLAALERARPAPAASVTAEGALTHLEELWGLAHGSISRTPEEATAKGFACAAQEAASLAGLELPAFRAILGGHG